MEPKELKGAELMAERYVIGVDSGSQSTKVSLIDQHGQVVCSAVQPLRPVIRRKPGWIEHPGDDLWDSLRISLQRLLAGFRGPRSAILGIGLCAIRCCRVFLKSNGTLAAPVMSWMDVRAYEPFEDDPGIAYTGSTSGYLTFRLTGQLRDTIANAYQEQFPTDMERWNWSDDPARLAACGIPIGKLFAAHLPGEILGPVTAEAAAATGVPQGIPVVATANDKAVEALGSGLLDEETGLLSLGTYITSMVTGSEYRPAAKHYFTNLSAVPRRYLYESGGIRGGMWHVSWFREVVNRALPENCCNGVHSADDSLEQEAEAVPAGAEGLLVLPDWLAPADQLYRKGVMIGFSQKHTRGHIYRALLEGIAMRMKINFDAMAGELGLCPERLIACGGGSNSRLFMQIIADVFGIPVVRNRINGAAALGGAVSAAVAVGLYPDYRTAVRAMVHVDRSFCPEAESQERYAITSGAVFSRLPELLEDALKALHGTADSQRPANTGASG